MKLREYVGKRVKVLTDEDRVFEGDCVDYAQPSDNDPEIASIAVETSGLTYELYENEIKNIEVI